MHVYMVHISMILDPGTCMSIEYFPVTYFQWEQQHQQEGKNRDILLMGAAAAAGADKGTMRLGLIVNEVSS